MVDQRNEPLTPAQVRARLRDEIDRAGGLVALASRWGVDPGQLCRQARGTRDVIAPAILERLHLVRAEARYVPR